MKNKAKLRHYLDLHPEAWISTRTVDIANETGLARQYVHDMLCVVAAEKFTDTLPTEYEQRRCKVLRAKHVRADWVKAMLSNEEPLENIAFAQGVSVDYVRRVRRQVRADKVEAMLREGESITNIASAACVTVNYVRRVKRKMKKDG